MTLRSLLRATGIRRVGGRRAGFRHLHADGSDVSPASARRIAALRIPAAWREVAIARSARDKVQAIGRDAAGRWQYLYARAHSERRSRAKYDRLIAFGEALPALREALARDLERPGLPLERASACAVAMLSTCFLRAGSETYAADNGSFGLATLRNRHVAVEGDTIRLDYRGKHGRRQRHGIRSRRLAAIVFAMKLHPGVEVFKFVDARGGVRDLRRAHLNLYIQRAMGAGFSARDFRTWAGTLLCAGALARAGCDAPNPKRAMTAAIRETAAWLGNTPAMARKAYIHPAVLLAFERGEVVRHALRSPEALIDRNRPGLDASEQDLLALLERDRLAREANREPAPRTVGARRRRTHGPGRAGESVRVAA